MKFMRPAFAAASFCFLLSGCNFYLADLLHDSPRQANNGFKYLSSEPDQKQFLVDDEKNNFSFTDRYHIRNENKNPEDAVIGRSVDITSPVQISGIFPHSATTIRDNHAYLRISPGDNAGEIENLLLERLLAYLGEKDISVEAVDAASHKIITGWYSSDYSFGKLTVKKLEDDDDLVEYRTKYAVAVNRDSSGAVIMDVELTNFKSYHDARRVYAEANAFVQNRFASLFLNDYISSFAYRASGGAVGADYVVSDPSYYSVHLGKDPNGQYGWVITGPFDSVWPRFIKMLPKYGFAVLFQEKIRGIVDTNYDEEDEEFFQEQGVDNFVIEDDKYRFQMGVHSEGAIITIFDNSKQPLNDDLFLKMYSGFAKALEKELN